MLLAPAVAVMNRLKYPQKFALISLVFALPLALVMYFLVSEINQRIEFTQKEQDGGQYLRPLRQLLGHVAQSQMFAHDYTRRGPAHRPDLVRKQLEIDDGFKALADVHGKLGERLAAATPYNVLRENWRFLKERQLRLEPGDSDDLHAALTGDIRGLISHVGNTSNLILDPDLDSYYLMDAVLLKLPESADIARQLWLLGKKVIASGNPTGDAERSEFIRLVSLLRSTVDATRSGMEVAFRNNPAQNLKARLVDPLNGYVATTEQFLATLDQQIVRPGRVGMQADAYDRMAMQLLEANLAFWDRSMAELDGLLLARIDGFVTKRGLVMAFAGLALLLVAWLFVAFYAAVVGTVRSLEETTRRMVGGRIDERFHVETRDELGQMAGSFNAIADRLRLEWAQAREESARATAAEAELRVAKEVAEEATRAKSIFLANMSHELRTPLNAILGATELLQEDARELGREDEREPLERVLRAGRHLLSLINDILDLSKIEAGKMELHAESFAVAQLVDDVVAMVAPLAGTNGNQIETNCAPDLGLMVADPTRVRQALLNLASNANKFTEHGKVAIRASREPGAGGDWIRLEVSDTGIGLTPEQMGRLFQEFEQADASTTRKYGGTGLGLAISRRFCRMMGGDITVSSESGRGSTFTIRLPAGQPAALSAVQARGPGAAAPARAARAEALIATDVLVVDDDEAARDITARFLMRQGFSVVTAGGGHEGLRLARELRPAAITLDVMMPDMDGWTVLSALKGDPALADIPVVLMTVLDEPDRGYALGAADYVTKPVDRERLGQVLRRVVGSGGHRVLLVDDDADTRRLVARSLQRHGWAVSEAENGRVGLARLSEALPDAIVLDLMMPELDGFGFLEALRSHAPWRGIPVIVATAKDLTEHDQQRLHGGVEHVLQKGSRSRDEMLREVGERLSASIRRAAAPRRDGPAGEAPWALLVVDDNEDNRYTLMRRLQREGYTDLTSAEDGQQALDLMAARRFDLVLLDVMMPGLNGYQVLERMRADAKLRQVPVVMISALDELASVIRCIELGAEDYLSKPFDPTLLRARVRAILEKKTLRDQARRTAGRMERELEQAREVQRNMVPQAFPVPTMDRPVELFATLEPARETGGDLYDFFWIGPRQLCLVIGDVSDKGASAALYMARTLSALRVMANSTANRPPSAAELLEHANMELARDNPQAMFVTLFLAILDSGTGRLDWVNAGHPAPFVIGSEGAVSRVELWPSIPVGVQAALAPSNGSMQLARGECLWLFTDGVTEAADADEQLFGDERLADALRAAAGLAPRDMVAAVLQHVRLFVGSAPVSDDIAVLACRWGADLQPTDAATPG